MMCHHDDFKVDWTRPRCSYSRHCGETETLIQTADGTLMCPDHKDLHDREQREGDQEFDEHGRKTAVMRNARAM